MGLDNRHKSRPVGGQAAVMVPFLDLEIGRVVQIPSSELRPGTVQVQVQGIEGPVWLLPEQLQPGELRHPDFEEHIRSEIREIHEAFEEHRELSLEEWVDGFRRDANPEREIALWLHAADIYGTFANDEPSAERRRDVYRCVVACLTASPETVWHVLEPVELSHEEAERVVDRFYGKED